ncbi:MAG TPA: hypothetical protein VFV10_09995 [Gammaproteobacteria bacterium]|nr:hypothetical protein [Gammaproteobacteria bacterium]
MNERPHEPVIVSRRFRGPTSSGNGGYVCGLVAARVPFPVTVRLLKPPPLEIGLDVVEAGERIELRLGDAVIAEARPGDVGDLSPPAPPTLDEAAAAASHYAGFAKHFAPECFVCGPRRAPGDGLRLFAGALGEPSAAVAAPWTPDASLDAGDGRVALEFMWAALDCPGYLAVAGDMRAMLLGELTARVLRRVDVGEACVVVGWPIRSSGRKHETGTAVFGAQKDLCALGRGLWIEPRATSGA